MRYLGMEGSIGECGDVANRDPRRTEPDLLAKQLLSIR